MEAARAATAGSAPRSRELGRAAGALRKPQYERVKGFRTRYRSRSRGRWARRLLPGGAQQGIPGQRHLAVWVPASGRSGDFFAYLLTQGLRDGLQERAERAHDGCAVLPVLVTAVPDSHGKFERIHADIPETSLLEDELEFAAVREREDSARSAGVLRREFDVFTHGTHRQRDPGIALGRPPDGDSNPAARLERGVSPVEELERLRHEHDSIAAGDGIEG